MARSFSIPGVFVLAVLYVAMGMSPDYLTHLPTTSTLWGLLFPGIVIGIPFGFWLPIARAGSMGDQWHVPKRTLLMPRWLVCLSGTTMMGITIAMLILTVLTDLRYGFFFAMHASATIAFVVSANRRFLRYPSSEFVMRSPFPYSLRKRM